MAAIETVRVQAEGFPDGLCVNREDFDPAKQALWTAPAAADAPDAAVAAADAAVKAAEVADAAAKAAAKPAKAAAAA